MPDILTLQELQTLLKNPVMLPITEREKGCRKPGWTSATLETTSDPKWQAALLRAGNVGILLGPASGDLISIDCDTDEYLHTMRDLNPSFENTLITRGSRGGNIWLFMEGPYPQKTIAVKGFGEFRSKGGQTVIFGTHPSGSAYHRLNDRPPLRVSFDSIRWPDAAAPKMRRSPAASPAGSREGTKREGEFSCASASASLGPCVPASLGNKGEQIAARIQAENEFRKTSPVLMRVIECRIESLLPLTEGSRNSTLTTEIVPRLFNAVSLPQMLAILEYLANTGQLGGYSLSDTASKAAHVYRAMEAGFPATLPPGERSIYAALDPFLAFTFRLCRSLAADDSNPAYPPPRFFLSTGDLASRHGRIMKMTAHRALRKLVLYGVLTCDNKGTPKGNGSVGVAAEFTWGLPLGCQPA